MRKYNKRANYNANPNYLDFLDALRKFFTNDQDIIPIIAEFNFYVNGVYSTPLTDLFRMYDENPEDIHGAEKTKTFIDDGTIGIINQAIYKQGNGSLLTALENTRVLLENKKSKYNVGYNPITKTYTEALKTPVNVLPDGNPVVLPGGLGGPGGGPMNDNPVLLGLGAGGPGGAIGGGPVVFGGGPGENPNVIGGTKVSLPPKPKKKKSFWKYFSFLSYKQKLKK